MSPQPDRLTGPAIVLHREDVQVATRRVGVERVVFRKRIVTETRQLQVTIRREELIVDHHPLTAEPHPPIGDDPAASAPAAPLVIVLSEEVPVLELRSQPYERVTVSVHTTTRQQPVAVTVRSEQADVTVDESTGEQPPSASDTWSGS